MPPPMSSSIYNSINDKLNPVYVNCANENIQSAGQEVRKLKNLTLMKMRTLIVKYRLMAVSIEDTSLRMAW